MRGTTGRILHRAAEYDLLTWLMTGGRERAFRERLLALARVYTGESVLDVGCGTGTLALAAKRCVGATGRVDGIDASADMVARATRKAAKAELDVRFQQAVIEALPFAGAEFDVVLSTVMLHHLPGPAKNEGAREMRRVTKPGGRVFIADFGAPSRHGILAHLHRHGHTKPADVLTLLIDAGLEIIDSGPAGMHDLHFTLAVRPGGSSR
jgi:ubiquinone/menaquinone biosynthesis C-methylase UbiE